MLKNMQQLRAEWSDADDRQMVAVRRLAQTLNDRNIPAAVGRGEYNTPEVRVNCNRCGRWFTPSFDLPGSFTCDACY